MKKKDNISAQILDLENEIEMMVEQKISGITAKRKKLSALKSKLKKMCAAEKTAIAINYSPHTW